MGKLPVRYRFDNRGHQKALGSVIFLIYYIPAITCRKFKLKNNIVPDIDIPAKAMLLRAHQTLTI